MKLELVKVVVGLVAAVWSMFMTFKLFELVDATELLWFLFWGSVPLAFALALLRAVTKEE